MHIEYSSSDQRFVEPELGNCWLKATGGPYRPTWLIRTSDWKKVPGNEATDGYCALSYCWEQSGEIIKIDDSEYDCNNSAGHRLVLLAAEEEATTTSEKGGDLGDSAIDIQQDPTHIVEVIDEKNVKKKIIKLVTYDGILQQICQDFQIDYLWYDKVCINQASKEEKLCEIKQMHLIYSNARYTVALVPEINILNPALFERPDKYAKTKARKKTHDIMWKSEWSKRSWTFEELMMSKRILVVGRNAHAWHQANTGDDDDNGVDSNGSLAFADPLVQILDFKNRKLKSANQVLKYAQFRTSAKEHDKIFALANIFHGIVSINIDYNSGIQEVVHDFFRCIGERDLSVMCFGSVRNKNGSMRFKSKMNMYDLPSWTGVNGLHTHGAVSITQLPDNNHFVDDSMRMHIKCKHLPIHPIQYFDHPDACLFMSSPVPGMTESGEQQGETTTTTISAPTPIDRVEKHCDHILSATMMKTNKKAINAEPINFMAVAGCGATHFCMLNDTSPTMQLSLTEHCNEEAAILPILFDSKRPFFREKTNVDGSGSHSGWEMEYRHSYFMPVLKKRAGHATYKAIGIILFKLYMPTEIPEDPLKVLQEAFGDSCEEQEFVIE